MLSSSYVRLLIFLPVVLIQAWASSSLAFCMMYSACKLNKQSDNIQSCRTPFPVLNQSVVPSKVLTVAFWPHMQVSQETGKMVWYSHVFKNFSQLLWSAQSKAFFNVVSEAEVDVFYLVFTELKYLFSVIQQMLAIWSLVPLPPRNPACTFGSSQFTYCWSLTLRIFGITLLVCKMSTIAW